MLRCERQGTAAAGVRRTGQQTGADADAAAACCYPLCCSFAPTLTPPPPPPPPPPPLGLPSSRPRLQVIGQAFGNAAMILASGKKGYRYALPNSRIMTCPPRMNRAFGNTSNCMIKANELENSTQVGGGRGGGAGRCGGGKAVSEGGGVCERVAESLRAGQRGVLAPQRGQGSCKAKRQACTRSPHILLRTAAS